METYDKIKKLCDARSIKVSDMAKGTGIRNSVLSELKMGRTKQLSVPTLEKIAAFFDVPVASLLPDETKEEENTKAKRELIYSLTESVSAEQLDAILETVKNMLTGNQDAE